MTFTTAHMSISLDGFVAGPDQSRDDPIGRGGMRLHRWHLEQPQHDVDARWTANLLRPRGAYVMGRNMFGPIRGDWETDGEQWRGWWGDEPPYHAPVFVLTHYEHDPIEMAGGTTFHFVTGGIGDALAQARAAGDGDVDIAGGASAVRQALAAGELDELSLDIIPVLLGHGERIFDETTVNELELVETEHSPLATHVRYRFTR
ncbi:5-amino-6-(5-phosphoribosylamino)uracil reductase [Mycobacterium dioxanotrophicus]|jgi:dihydrofolate reductase|uniref:5-amino-6-(5-phosphoribosylamino)uracil reductase n=1 Tax=Mycobacterium dioxanotrophicus TaxID=482462 RepID=A0A1Y0CAU9_9MYCO|nr:dihydrofolate reductase family protein [Mycobacterium dioxanotrophicus]ART72378.1 5-amino-6-(5-phosphoribosylamino)uracil reductase [Mycobacterium dioxanotrophicus]